MAEIVKHYFRGANPKLGIVAGAAVYPSTDPTAPAAFDWANINTSILNGADVYVNVNGCAQQSNQLDSTNFIPSSEFRGTFWRTPTATRGKARIIAWEDPVSVALRPAFKPFCVDALYYDAPGATGWSVVEARNNGYIWKKTFGNNWTANARICNVYKGIEYGDNNEGYVLTPRMLKASFVAGANTGTGTITNLFTRQVTVPETFTVSLTSATAFTVTGSVSGALASGTVGTAYNQPATEATSKIAFTVTAGGTAFVSGDTFTITTYTDLSHTNEYHINPPFNGAGTTAQKHDLYLWCPTNTVSPSGVYNGLALEFFGQRADCLWFASLSFGTVSRLHVGTPNKPALWVRGGARFYHDNTADNIGVKDVVLHGVRFTNSEYQTILFDNVTVTSAANPATNGFKGYHRRILLVNCSAIGIPGGGDPNSPDKYGVSDTGSGHGINVTGRTYGLTVVGGTYGGQRHAAIHVQKVRDQSPVTNDPYSDLWPKNIFFQASRTYAFNVSHPIANGYYRGFGLCQFGGVEINGITVTGQTIQTQPSGLSRIVGCLFKDFNRPTYITPATDTDDQLGYDTCISYGDNGGRQEVQAATTANITLSGTQTIDGIAVTVGQFVLVKNQTTQSENGVYTVAAGAWSRTTTTVSSGLGVANINYHVESFEIYVRNGTTNAGTNWKQTTTGTITVGTTNLVFAALTSPTGNPYVGGNYTVPRKAQVRNNIFIEPVNYVIDLQTNHVGQPNTLSSAIAWTDADLEVTGNTVVSLNYFSSRRYKSVPPNVNNALAGLIRSHNWYSSTMRYGTFFNNLWIVPDTTKIFLPTQNLGSSLASGLGYGDANNSQNTGAQSFNNLAYVSLAAAALNTDYLPQLTSGAVKSGAFRPDQAIDIRGKVRPVPPTVGALEA